MAIATTKAQRELVDAVLGAAAASGVKRIGPRRTSGWVRLYVHVRRVGNATLAYGMVLVRRGRRVFDVPLELDAPVVDALGALKRARERAAQEWTWLDLTITADREHRVSWGRRGHGHYDASDGMAVHLSRVAAAAAAELGLWLTAQGSVGIQPEQVIRARTAQVIAEQLFIEEESVFPSARLVDDLGASPTDLLHILLGLEVYFGVELRYVASRDLHTVADAVRCVTLALE